MGSDRENIEGPSGDLRPQGRSTNTEFDPTLTFSSIDDVVKYAINRGFDPNSENPTLKNFLFSEKLRIIPLDGGGFLLEAI